MRTLLTVDTARTLAHVALLAAWEGEMAASEQIFAALEAAKPKEPNVRLCRALVLAFQDRYAEASKLLRQVLARQPDNVTARGLLGFVLFTAGEAGWQALLESVVNDRTDPAIAAIARSILSEHREAPAGVAQDERNKVVCRV
jgi:cytochrome c-type biogenesis protein CcmH/NrfG